MLDQRITQLVAMVESQQPWKSTRQWFHAGPLSVYLRITSRHFPGHSSLVNTIEIASIDVAEKYRGTGVATQLFETVETTADETDRLVYVESVLSDRFAGWIERRGYTRIAVAGCPPSFLRYG